MFIFSKLVDLLLSPTAWIGLGLIGSFLFREKKNLILKITLTVFIVFSNPLLSNWFLQQLEHPPIQVIDTKQYDIGIVLTGMSSGRIDHPGMHFESGADRFTSAVELYHKGVIKKILFTGGSGLINDVNYSESPFLRQLALTYQVPDSCIIIETKSRNTYENAAFSKPIIDSLAVKHSLLITSAFHMKRSIRCFNQLNISVTPYPTDFRASKLDPSIYNIFPSTGALFAWDTILHEYFGLIYYKLKGYI